jgi:hypothetical protein
MKRIIALAVMLYLPSLATAQEGGIGLYHQVVSTKAEGVSPRTHLTYVDAWKAYNDFFGVWMTGFQEPLYLSSAFGPYVALGDYVEIGLGLGWESEKEDRESEYQTRSLGAGYLRLGPAQVYYERYQGGGGWHQADITGSVGNVALGLVSQTDVGMGPQVGLRIPIKGFKLHVSASPVLFEKVEGNWERRSLVSAALVWEK